LLPPEHARRGKLRPSVVVGFVDDFQQAFLGIAVRVLAVSV